MRELTVFILMKYRPAQIGQALVRINLSDFPPRPSGNRTEIIEAARSPFEENRVFLGIKYLNDPIYDAFIRVETGTERNEGKNANLKKSRVISM